MRVWMSVLNATTAQVEPDAEHGRAGQHRRERAGCHQPAAGGEAEQPEAERPGLGEAADEPCRGQPAEDRADALHAADHPEEGRLPAEALLDDGEDDGLVEADHEHGDRDRLDRPRQHRRGSDVAQAGRDLHPEPRRHRLGPRIGGPHRPQAGRRDDEGDRIDDGHRPTTEGGVQPGARQRAQEAQSLLDRLDEAVGRCELTGRDHPLQQRGHARCHERERDAVEHRDHQHDPGGTVVAHREQRQDRQRRQHVRDDQEPAAADPVDDVAGQGRGERRRHDEQDHAAGRGAAAGEVLHPDARAPAASSSRRAATPPGRRTGGGGRDRRGARARQPSDSGTGTLTNAIRTRRASGSSASAWSS